jgi:hypothetical protein
MDTMSLVILYVFVKYSDTWRLIISFTLFYLLRGIAQNIFFIEKPPGYLWDYPGSISIFIGYAKSTDFFFSGHLGACVMSYFEFRAHGMYKWGYFTLFTLVC